MMNKFKPENYDPNIHPTDTILVYIAELLKNISDGLLVIFIVFGILLLMILLAASC